MKRLIVVVCVVMATISSARAQFDLGSLFGKVKEVAAEAAGDAIDEVIPEELQQLLGIAIPELEIPGTWSYDKESENVTLGIGDKHFTTRMTENGEHINILFKADKLLELVKTISTKSSNTTLTAIGAIVKSYDGMNLGFECEKVKVD